MSLAALTGGYAFWSVYNLDMEKLYAGLLSMLNTDDQGLRAHVKKYYEHHYWNNYSHLHSLDFWAKPLSTATKRILMQFLPSLCKMSDPGRFSFSCWESLEETVLKKVADRLC